MTKPGAFSLLHDDCDPVAAALQLNGKRRAVRARLCSYESHRREESRAAAGLVSVSTSCRDVSVPVQWASDCITIDKAQARITRLRKGVGVGAKALHNAGPLGQSMYMLTLTYRGTNAAWNPKHISDFLHTLRTWYYGRTGTRKLRYTWVAELQGRGVIHYHVVVWLEKGIRPPFPDRPWRHKGTTKPPMWQHGMSNRIQAHAPIAYLMKYLSKINQKNVGSFPHGARIFGLGGLDDTGRACKRWVLWPSYVQGNCAAGANVKPAPGGGYIDRDTGEIFLSEYAPTGGGFTSFKRVRKTPRRLQPDGPFSWAPSFLEGQAS